MLERDLQRGVLDVARFLGYLAHAERPAWSKKGYRTPIQGDAGWPDVVLVGHGRFIVRELKVGRNVLSSEQVRWLEELRAAGVDAGVWSAADWESGLIEAELRRGTATKPTVEIHPVAERDVPGFFRALADEWEKTKSSPESEVA